MAGVLPIDMDNLRCIAVNFIRRVLSVFPIDLIFMTITAALTDKTHHRAVVVDVTVTTDIQSVGAGFSTAD